MIGSMNQGELIFNINNICARELEHVRPLMTEVFNNRLEYLNLKYEDEGSQPDINTNHMSQSQSESNFR